jgi:uncharacterized protein
MELMGTVLNVVDFGAFVDIGLKDTGLVHVSQLASKFIQDPHDCVSVGDIVTVWVMAVDKERRRVSLTLIDPASRRNEERRPPRQERRRPDRPPQTQGEGGARPAGQQNGGQRQGGQRPGGRPGGGQQRGGQQGGGGRSSRPDRGSDQKKPHSAPRPKPKPRPVVPLTKGMAEGREPLRTFGDLKQFIELKRDTDDQAPESSPG